MPKFRKKPIEIEAERVADLLDAAAYDWSALPPWAREGYDDGKVLFLSGAVEIVTLEGVMRGERNDWIIRGVQGELYPCKPDIFAATYEAVEA
jgi:hypothetical protein